MGEDIPLSHPLLPLPPVARVMGKTCRYIWLQPPGQNDPDEFFCLFVLLCLFALRPRCLVVLYQLKACNVIRTLINEGL
jgi:hypothetical protein